MIQYIVGQNIIETSCQAFVCPVNLKSIMGKGLALDTKRAYPEIYDGYCHWCCIKGVKPGDCIGIETNKRDSEGRRKMVICFATKNDWRDPSKLEWIRDGVEKSLISVIKESGITSVAIPKLGCGLGGLSWDDVQAILLETCAKHKEINWQIYVD